MPLEIRPYALDDWDAVCDIYDLSKPDELHGLVERSSIPPLTADPGMRQLFEESTVHVAVKGRRVAGFIGHRASSITWLFVHPAHRQQGMAAQLLLHVIQALPFPATLHVAKLNEPAVRLYHRLGFSVEREFAGHFNGQPVQVLKLRHDPEA